MITEDSKQEILAGVLREEEKLGSANKVAQKLGINAGGLSSNIKKPENWGRVSDSMWTDIADKLGIILVNRGWKIAETKNVKMMHRTLSDAQKEALFIGVSEKAGSGKSASITDFVMRDANNAVYMLQCQEWSRKAFLSELATTLGIQVSKYGTGESIIEDVVRFFKQRSKEVRPLLILDEADKLRPAAKRVLIPFYNKLEDQIGLVCAGTENLEKEIKDGVRRHDKGYDEIDSRLGRSFVHLIGYDQQDVAAICKENGLTNPDVIKQVWEECQPISKPVLQAYNQERIVKVVEDGRLIKRKITRAKLRLQRAA